MVLRELCSRLRPLVCLPYVPAATATATAAAPPDAANYWPRSLERGGESRSCRAGLRQALTNQRTAQRAPGLGRGHGAGARAGRGQPETSTLKGPSGTRPAEPRRESGEAWWAGQVGARGQGGAELASAAAEPSHELHTSPECRNCRKDEEDLILWASLSPSHIFVSRISYLYFSLSPSSLPLSPSTPLPSSSLPSSLFVSAFWVCLLLYLPLLSFSGSGRKKRKEVVIHPALGR